MIIDDNKKIIIIEVPHCGSTFILNSLIEYKHLRFNYIPGLASDFSSILRRHCTVEQGYEDGFLTDNIDDFKIFYMVRHPEDRMVSYYYQEVLNKNNKNLNLNEFIVYSLYSAEFTKQFADNRSLYQHYNPDKKKNFIALKYEDFDKSIETIFNALDLEKPNTNIRVNKHEIKEKITKKSRILINNMFDKDFKEYNYRKKRNVK